jgi:hypothetical protein
MGICFPPLSSGNSRNKWARRRGTTAPRFGQVSPAPSRPYSSLRGRQIAPPIRQGRERRAMILAFTNTLPPAALARIGG